MNKKTLVDAILLAASALAGGWSEADREQLMAMNEDQLKLISNKVGKAKEAPAAPAQVPTPPAANAAPATAPAAAPAPTPQPEPKKIISLQEYVEAAPKEMREVLQNSLSVYNDEKAKLIEAITANKNNIFTKEELSNRPLGELRGLARLAGVEQPAAPARPLNYAGQGQTPTGNSEAAEEALAIPTINFEPEKKTTK